MKLRSRSAEVEVPETTHHHHTIPIADVTWRALVRVAGRVKTMRVQPWGDGVPTLECTLADHTGGLTVVFLGRRKVAGVNLGSQLMVEGTVIESRGRLALLNPIYELLPALS